MLLDAWASVRAVGRFKQTCLSYQRISLAMHHRNVFHSYFVHDSSQYLSQDYVEVLEADSDVKSAVFVYVA